MSRAGAGAGRTPARKADFGHIYTEPDPRPYFRALRPLDYQVPAAAAPVADAAVAAAGRAGAPPAVLDLCCSYGINAALLGTSVGWAELGRRYTAQELAALTAAELAAADRTFYTARARPGVRVVGLDSSAPAVGYGRRAGLLADGWAEDLEVAEPSASLASGLATVGTVVCTGGVGYIGPRTFARLLAAHPAPELLWLVVCVLRVFDYAPVETVFRRHGLVTERLPGTLRQRRFADPGEAAAAVADAAFFTSPRRDAAYSHELESIGTLHLAAAAAAGGVTGITGITACAAPR
jgi:SAM-dependent methyltransferase